MVAQVSYATTYYVRPQGTNGADGLSYSNAWQTIGKANTATRPGDIVYVYESYPAVYGNFPNPDSAGSNPTGGGFITFIGASLNGDVLADSSLRWKVQVVASDLVKPYTVIKGLHVLGGLGTGAAARFDTVKTCIFDNGLGISNSDYINIIQNSFLGGNLVVTNSSGVSKGVFISDNKFWDVHTGGTLVVFGGGAVGSRGQVDSLNFRFNRVHLNNLSVGCGGAQGGSPADCIKLYDTFNSNFRGNYWDINQTNPCRLVNPDGTDAGCPSGLSLLTLRDSIRTVDFSCDTLVAYSDYCNYMVFSSSGNYANTVKYVTVDSCQWQGKNLDITFGEPFKPLNLTYNTIVSVNGNINMGLIDTTSVWDHNTFVMNASIGVVHMWAQTGNWTAGPKNRFTFTNNILAENTYLNCYDVCKPSGWVGMFHWGMFWGDETKWAGRVTTNNNLYYVRSTTGCPNTIPTFAGTRNIGFHDGDYQCSASGAGSLFDSKTYVIGGDSLSVSGNPKFALGTIGNWDPQWNGTGIFNSNISSLSSAKGAGTSGSDIGAKAYISTGRISYASSQQLSFDCTGANCSGMTREVTVVNVGTDNLTFSSITSSDGLFTADLTHFILGPGQDTTLTITSNTSDDNSRQVVMTVVTDDPVAPVTYIYLNINSIWKDEQ